jgi:hypothetical protein
MYKYSLLGIKTQVQIQDSSAGATWTCFLEVGFISAVIQNHSQGHISLAEGKRGNAFMTPIVPGYDKPSGGRQYPVAAISASLAKPTADRPALMAHSEVVTLFHEMGHVFHELLSVTKFSRFHGTMCVTNLCTGLQSLINIFVTFLCIQCRAGLRGGALSNA